MSKPILPPLRTPSSCSFPSNIKSPLDNLPSAIKSPMEISPTISFKDEPLKTPMTPPVAYLDFLAKRSSSVLTPPTTGTALSFEKPSLKSNSSNDSVTTKSSVDTDCSSDTDNYTESDDKSENIQEKGKESENELTSDQRNIKKPRIERFSTSPVPVIDTLRSRRMSAEPYSPRLKQPVSAHTPKRFCIIPFSPQSPSSHMLKTPLSAGHISFNSSYGLKSPIINEILSPFSPSENNSNIQGGKVVLKQVITRTYTVSKSNIPKMEPVPITKRRRIEDDDRQDMTNDIRTESEMKLKSDSIVHSQSQSHSENISLKSINEEKEIKA